MASPPEEMAAIPLVRARDMREIPAPGREQRFGYAAIAGRLAEVSGGGGAASLVIAAAVVREAQAAREPVVWVGCGETVFFPPDFAANGVDLDSLTVVRAIEGRDALRATHHLLHAGAFGLVVLDLQAERVSQGILGRFARLAERNGTALLCLTDVAQDGGLGSLISVRVRTRLRRLSPGTFSIETRVVKDKRRGPWPRAAEVCRAPPGLR